HAVGPSRHRRARVHREGPDAGAEGRDRRCRPDDPHVPHGLSVGGAVDLHSHTTASDGTLTPRELVALAAKHGVRVLAITDHDSTEGIAEARLAAASQPGLTIVPGIEINCDVEGAEIHVLGYFLDLEADWFQAFLREQRAERAARIHRI